MRPITGTWFDFRHPNSHDGDYWNQQTAAFTAAQWEAKVEEMCDAGVEILCLLSVAIGGKSLYPSRLMPERWPLACEDPIEAVLRAADRRGAQVYLGVGFFQENTGETNPDQTDALLRRAVPRELNERYGHHPSFHGWYLPVEAMIVGHFPDHFVAYASSFAADLKSLSPRRPVMIAPYGTRTVIPDDRFVAQLQALGVDYVAYQDEVGVEKTRVDELDAIWSRVRLAHDRAGIPLWADVEIFRFEGPVYQSALLPAPMERIAEQLAIAGRYVDKILCYQYLGLMDHPESQAHAGHPDAVRLYREYLGRYTR